MKLTRLIKYAMMVSLSAGFFSSCSSDDEPEKLTLIDTETDLVHNRLVYQFDLDSEQAFRIPLNTLGRVDVSFRPDTPLEARRVDADGVAYVEVDVAPGFTGDVLVAPVRISPAGNPDAGRHVILVGTRGGATPSGAPRRESGRTASSPLFSVYSEYLGKGTMCFGALGNTTKSVMLYDKLANLDESVVTVNSTLNEEKMIEKNETSSESMMTELGVNIGVDFTKTKKSTVGFKLDEAAGAFIPNKETTHKVSGSFNFGYDGKVSASEDWEYYLNIYMVRKSEVAVQMDRFELTDNNQKPDPMLIGLVNPDFISQLSDTDPSRFDADRFVRDWGTDVITQGSFGGILFYCYGRKENAYERSLAIDASAELKVSHPNAQGKGMEFIFTAKNSPYISGGVDASYKNAQYNAASYSTGFFECRGGNMNDNNAEEWLKGFNDLNNSHLWSIIGYNRLSDNALDLDDETQSWALYPVDQMANTLLGIYLSQVKQEEMTASDKAACDRFEQNARKISDARISLIEEHALDMGARTRMVVADFMMKNGSNGHKHGEPSPFIAQDPRDPSGKKYLMYYPMFGNRYSPTDKGYAIETSQNAYYPGALDDEDQYWYYALAKETDCDGIVDIRFLRKEEFPDYFYLRGDGAHCGGLKLNDNFVCVKYYDPAINTPNQKITAVGLYLKQNGDKSVSASRIFASSGGAELPLSATESEYNSWQQWWSTDAKVIDYQWNEGSMLGETPIWGICSTKDLPIDKVKNITHPKKWGE